MSHRTDTIDRQPEPKTYLGDGAYARIELAYGSKNLVITAENGLHVTDCVVLGPGELKELLRFCRENGAIQ